MQLNTSISSQEKFYQKYNFYHIFDQAISPFYLTQFKTINQIKNSRYLNGD